MSPSLSWIDPDELAASLARAGIPAAGRSAGREGAGLYGPALSAAGSFRPLPGGPRPEPPPALISSPPAGPEPRGNGIAAASPGELQLPQGTTLQARLKALFADVVAQSECRRLFVVDAEGLVLMEENAEPVMVTLASSFVGLLRRVEASLDSSAMGSIAVDLDQEQVLQVLQAETPIGRYTLGFVVHRPVPRDLVRRFQQGLVNVMSEGT